MILPLAAKIAADEAELEDMLNQVGVKLVYVDFHLLENTEPGVKLLGQLFDREERAQQIIDFRDEQIARVTDVLERENPEKPLVFMYRIAGLRDCCDTFGHDHFGKMVEMAGSNNLGAQFLPGPFGSINPEQVIASNPDIIVATGSDWTNGPGRVNSSYVNVGPDAASVAGNSRAALAALMAHPAFTDVKAANGSNVYAIWHGFYTSPYRFTSIQRQAKWFHPELFCDLDPDETFRTFHERFLPVPCKPGYWLALNER